MKLDRRSSMRILAGTCAGLIVAPRLIAQNRSQNPPRPDPLVDDQVHEFVKVAHGDLDRTRELLDDEPRLIKASWDWGGGDFESALGAAGHMGRRDIAHLLLDRGAPLELCAAAMLGQLAVVEAALTARPSLLHVPGPHGIPLTAHARKGGEQAAVVLSFLTDFEKRHPKSASAEPSEPSTLGGAYAGIYRGSYQQKEVGYEVIEHGRKVTLRPLDGREPQEYEPDGEHRFKQARFSVSVVFAVENGRAVSFKAVQRDTAVELFRVE
jgi:hypothetical protein